MRHAFLAILGLLLLAGCAAGPAAENDPGPPPGTATARMNGQFGWYAGIASHGH